MSNKTLLEVITEIREHLADRLIVEQEKLGCLDVTLPSPCEVLNLSIREIDLLSIKLGVKFIVVIDDSVGTTFEDYIENEKDCISLHF